ncbi:MAG: carboxypeptidase-like regulatory domain-containing protein, partial [Gemmatimonadota bacterium]
MNHSRRAIVAAGLLVLGALGPADAAAQAPPEVIRGQITDIHQRPVAGASVTVIGERTHSTHTAQTSKDGRFVVLFSEGEGGYTILARKI